MSDEKQPFFPKPFRAVYTNAFLLTILGLGVLDLVTKYIATSFLSYGRSIDFIGSFVKFTLVYNTGGIFGMFSNNLIPSTILMSFAIVILVLLYWKENDALGSRTGWMLVMGGALGNFIDKLFRKISLNAADPTQPTYWELGMTADRSKGAFVGVVDFVELSFPSAICFWKNGGDCSWYIFNLADSYITIGVSLLIISMYKIGKAEKEALAKEAG